MKKENFDLKSKIIFFDEKEIPINVFTSKLCTKVMENGDVYLVFAVPQKEETNLFLGKIEINEHQAYILKENYISQTGDLDLKHQAFELVYWDEKDFKENKLD